MQSQPLSESEPQLKVREPKIDGPFKPEDFMGSDLMPNNYSNPTQEIKKAFIAELSSIKPQVIHFHTIAGKYMINHTIEGLPPL